MPIRKQSKADIVAVANEAGVSISTVSRSFNHPDLVKPQTRKKIDRAVRKLGYIRNRAAQTMHGIRSATIGLVVPTIDHAIFAEVTQAFSDAVEHHGFTILVASHGYDLEREYAIFRKFLEHRVDGVAFIGMDHSEDLRQLIAHQDIPAMSVWNYDPSSGYSCVGADNKAAGRTAAQYLLDLGHRDIVTMFPPVTDNDRARARRDGAMDAFEQAGLEMPQARQLEVSYSIAEAKARTVALIEADVLPTAILCGNDIIAQGVLHGLRKKGIDIPGQVSVMGIGDFPGSKEMEPPLSTVRIPAREIGSRAGETLAQAIIHQSSDIVHIQCDTALVPGGTCRPV